MSAILDFPDQYQFQTYINGFLGPESPSFVPNHEFISGIEAEIITILS